MEAGARAEREKIEDMKNNVVQKSPLNNNPFERYGNTRW